MRSCGSDEELRREVDAFLAARGITIDEVEIKTMFPLRPRQH
jgi:DUF1365 family protein